MRRRSFITNIAWLTGGLIGGCQLPANAFKGLSKKVKGHVISGGKGIKNVLVSDGYTVIPTDKKGEFEIEIHRDAVSLFISTPSGYHFLHENNVARHYYILDKIADTKDVVFELMPLEKNDDEHEFIIWADPQVKNMKDVEKMMEHTVTDVQRIIKESPKDALIHGITVGDIVWDELQLFAEYDKAVAKMGIPFFQCLGNHDMDYRLGGDETSDNTFQATYGPTYYSFNRGQAHYIVMDNVRYLGTERNYDGYFQQNQLDWLKKDLSHVPKDKLIILSVHIPVDRHTKNNEDFYAILEDRNVHIMSGHTHYHFNSIRQNIYEHNHGTVCGAWWTGPICVDGTPNGYGRYKVKGNQLSWQYQATGQDKNYQMKIHQSKFDDAMKLVVVNIWNHDPAWKTEYIVDGKNLGVLEQFKGFDPVAYSTMLGPALPKPRGFAEPHVTDHLFKAMVPHTAREIKVNVTDRFGNIYSITESLSA